MTDPSRRVKSIRPASTETQQKQLELNFPTAVKTNYRTNENPSHIFLKKKAKKRKRMLSRKKGSFIGVSTQTEGELRISNPLQFSRGLKEILLSGKLSDFVLNVKGNGFRVHKVILAAHSPVFAAMMEHDTKERATGIVDIDDFEPITITHFLDFLYTGRVENLNSDNVIDLYEVADKYQVTELSDLCLEYMKNNISIENFCDILAHSLRYHIKNVTEVATQFFLRNSKEIAVTANWGTFLALNPVAGNELFLQALNLGDK